jgi:BA14K-like protein
MGRMNTTGLLIVAGFTTGFLADIDFSQAQQINLQRHCTPSGPNACRHEMPKFTQDQPRYIRPHVGKPPVQTVKPILPPKHRQPPVKPGQWTGNQIQPRPLPHIQPPHKQYPDIARKPTPMPNHYNGHDRYRKPRPGYSRHSDGWWYPLAAFSAGALIGSMTPPQPQPVYVDPPYYSNEHIQWCFGQYRSYRMADNSFQPSRGPRRQCLSPYL